MFASIKRLGTVLHRVWRTPMTPAEPGAAKRASDLGFFWFLVDAPMFVDDTLIGRFHDAVIRPDSITVSEAETTSATREKARRLGVEGKATGEIPFVVNLALKGKFDNKTTRTDSATLERQLEIPRTPERLLEEIVAFYLAYFPHRVIRVDPQDVNVTTADVEVDASYETLDDICNTAGPRPIVLIDAPPGTKLMPMAGEFQSGEVNVIYDELISALPTADKPLKQFSHEVDSEKTAESWAELAQRFDSRIAIKVLEAAGKKRNGARFDWIDFRMPIGQQSKLSPIHLHVAPAGQYSMGTFAYAFVRRGFAHGIRIVGTLKTGGDVNVLAIYER